MCKTFEQIAYAVPPPLVMLRGWDCWTLVMVVPQTPPPLRPPAIQQQALAGCSIHGTCELGTDIYLTATCVCKPPSLPPTCTLPLPSSSPPLYMWWCVGAGATALAFLCCFAADRQWFPRQRRALPCWAVAQRGRLASASVTESCGPSVGANLPPLAPTVDSGPRTMYTSLTLVLLCLVRFVMPMAVTTISLYRSSTPGSTLRTLFWIQCGSIVAGGALGTVVVTSFFNSILRRCSEGTTGSRRRSAQLAWLNANVSALRVLKLVAVFKPAVLRIIQSRMCGLSTFSIPLSAFFLGWRWMWIGDGLVTVVMDGVQLAVAIVRHRVLHQPLDTNLASEAFSDATKHRIAVQRIVRSRL
jgi:hypothetical protein